ncbi:hypothetical protein ANHS_2143 [Ligilactobacillus ruminis ATCC 25644]|nr:hypothetical protein ANHS_2143 [Ligilactobacillus ruminis ATCC 25644]
MSQIKKPDDLQSIAKPIRFFCMHDACYDGDNPKQLGGKFD